MVNIFIFLLGKEKDISCVDNNYHNNDTEKSLELIGKLIISNANSQNTSLKNQLLYQISHSLIVLNSKENFNNIFSSNISHPITGTLTNINNVPSLFIVKSAL